MAGSLGPMLVGWAAFLATWEVVTRAAPPADPGGEAASFEATRRAALRAASWFYRRFEPLVDEVAGATTSGRGRGTCDRVARSLAALVDEPPWAPAEWLAVARLRAAALALGLGLPCGWGLGLAAGGVAPAVAVIGLTFLTASWRAVVGLERRAARVRAAVRVDLPFAVELLRLTLRAGAGFAEALDSLVRQTSGSFISAHLAVVLREIERGTTRSEALARFQARLASEEVQDLVFALRQGDELGTPVAQVLEGQAHQLRFRQAQAVEKAAEQSKVRFTGPCVVVMCACMIAMLGPWLLKVYYDFSGIFR